MRKILILLLICICAASVFASDVSVYSFDVYQDSSSETLFSDWDDDMFTVNIGTINLETRLENNANRSIEVYMEGRFGLTSEIVRYKSVTIDADTSKTVSLSFTIPTTNREGTFPLDVFYRYPDTNGSTIKVTRSFDVKIVKDKITQNDFFENLTSQLVAQQTNNNRIQEILMNYTRLSDAKALCESSLGSCQANSSNLQKFENMYTTQNSDYVVVMKQLADCRAEKSSMHSDTEIVAAENKGRSQAQASNSQFLIFICCIVGLYFYMNKKKKQVGDSDGKDGLRKGEMTFTSRPAWKRV